MAGTEPKFEREHVKKTIQTIFRKIFSASSDELEKFSGDERHEDEVLKDLQSEIAFKVGSASQNLAKDGRARTQFTSERVQKAIDNIEVAPGDVVHPALRRIRMKLDVFKEVEVLKNFNFEVVIMSPDMKVLEYRGKKLFAIFLALFKKRLEIAYCLMTSVSYMNNVKHRTTRRE